ncbi:MAG: 4-hydroxy-2-oxoheptanedioate aldolase [Chloroflexi bacterium]|nr:MAG: 4-hydroxy-2-oxoheptanedioate aldolase [Chloroflexota bacterium]
MNGEQLKNKTKEGKVVYGSMISMGRNPRWTSAISDLGLDYVVIDMEHAPRGRAEVADYLVAMQSIGVVPIVRIPIPDSHYVTMALDAGAHGVLAPYCETVEEVREVIGACKWRPLKGVMVKRVVEEAVFPSEESRKYLENLNRNSVCIIGIESVPAIENLDKILDVNGVDAIFVGPNDLTISLGIPNQYDHPDYESALRQIIKSCENKNIPVLIHHQSVELTKKWLQEGAKFVLHSSDRRQMHQGYRNDFNAIQEFGSEIMGETSQTISESTEVI